jgi:dipeptidyl aminopeptidase/acylaminoacyl peptidase
LEILNLLGWTLNYGGSSGYGRKYVERLQGKWGIVDVEDCILAARTLASEQRTVIRGGSAGGYTVLAALSMVSDNKVFAAATSSYGVSDLKKLAEFTHKFESRYLDHLMGGSITEIAEVYEQRSPVNHADRIVTPLLVSCPAL